MEIVANFEIPYLQILNREGELKNPLTAFTDNSDKLISLYQQMVMIRMFDQKAINLQRTGKIGTYAPINGQEAISQAIGEAMRKEDVLVPYYRDYAAQLARGIKMSEILQYWGGDERGNDYACASEDLPICVPIASQCLHAAGIAFAFKHRNEKRVAVTCIGDGGSSEGDFYEAINIAGNWNLPIVFVINNNNWAISVPLKEQTHAKTLAQKGIAAGISSIQVDGNDILAMCETMEKTIEKARNLQGPTLIEAVSYRLSDHTTADDATRYQPKEEVENARLYEPIGRLKKYLEKNELWNDAKDKKLKEDCATKIQQAIDEYLMIPKPEISAAFDYLYENIPDYLIEQRAVAIEDAGYA